MTRTEHTGADRRPGEVNRDQGVVAAVPDDRSSTPPERTPGRSHRDRGRPVGCRRSPRRVPDLILRRGGHAVVEVCGTHGPPTQSGKPIRSDLIGDLCAVCGPLLEPVADLGEIVGYRVIETRAGAPPAVSAQVRAVSARGLGAVEAAATRSSRATCSVGKPPTAMNPRRHAGWTRPDVSG
jgi:hypothetical protein